MSPRAVQHPALAGSLRPGDLVEVRTKEEILATLDSQASLDGLPFMPEMLAYCGRRLRVYKRADKTCDTISGTGGRRMHGTVHLQDVRCDGSGHGACQAACLIHWKEAWLRSVDAGETEAPKASDSSPPDDSRIERASRQPGSAKQGDLVRYRCQATELVRASSLLHWWDGRQYVRDLAGGNVTVGKVLKSFLFAIYRKLVDIGIGYNLLISVYDRIQAARGGQPYPYRTGSLTTTPRGDLDLQPGEWARVKSLDEIMETVNPENRNRGLYFDSEMVRYCGHSYPVLARVTCIVDEKTGEMLNFGNPCIILSNVYCHGELSKGRLFCPRAIYSYWREIWLERVEPPGQDA